VEGRDLNYHYRIAFNLPEEPSVAVLFEAEAGKHSIEWLREKTAYQNCDYYSPAVTRKETTDSRATGKTARLNQLIDESDSEYIALLGSGADRITRNWLSELISKFRLDEGVGITCGRVHYDGSDGPSYTVANLDNNSVSYYAAFLDAATRHASGLQNLQFINGCNWHICVIKRSLWHALEGFDIERFPHHLGMLDFCYRATAQGSLILYTPDAMVDHWTSGQAPQDDDRMSTNERELFQKRHHDQLRQIERWYNSQHMVDMGESREDFYRWLVGNSL
jgi:GT2 family glycosyltransferase